MPVVYPYMCLPYSSPQIVLPLTSPYLIIYLAKPLSLHYISSPANETMDICGCLAVRKNRKNLLIRTTTPSIVDSFLVTATLLQSKSWQTQSLICRTSFKISPLSKLYPWSVSSYELVLIPLTFISKNLHIFEQRFVSSVGHKYRRGRVF